MGENVSFEEVLKFKLSQLNNNDSFSIKYKYEPECVVLIVKRLDDGLCKEFFLFHTDDTETNLIRKVPSGEVFDLFTKKDYLTQEAKEEFRQEHIQEYVSALENMSFRAMLSEKLNALRLDESFSIKGDGFLVNIKCIQWSVGTFERYYELSVTNIKKGITEIISERLAKRRLMDILSADRILIEEEKEQFRQEYIQERLHIKQPQATVSKSGEATANKSEKEIPEKLKKIQDSRFGAEAISNILKKNIPLEEKVLKTLYSEKAFVLTNNYYTDKRRMIIFAKAGDDFYIKTFTPSDVRTGLEDIPDVSLNEGNCTHIYKGTDEYKLPAGKGYLVVETRTVEAEGIKTILSGLTEREWSCHISDSLKIAPPSQKDYFTDRCSEDRNCLVYYIYSAGIVKGDEFLGFLQKEVVPDLKYEEDLLDKKSASYIFNVTGKDGSINKFIVCFKQNEEEKESIDMRVHIVYRNVAGKVKCIDAKYFRKALVFNSDFLNVHPEWEKYADDIRMVLMNMHKYQDQLRELHKLMIAFNIVLGGDKAVRILTNIDILQAVMKDYNTLYQRYMHCRDEFDAFEEEYNKCKDYEMLRFEGEKFKTISRALRDNVAKEFRESLTNSKEFDALQATAMESKIYTEKIKELHYFINMHKIIVSMNSNVETLKGLCDLGLKYSRTVAGLEGIDPGILGSNLSGK